MKQVELKNGVTVLVDPDPRFSSTTLAVCLLGGLSDEHERVVGISHLFEHLLFKQTKKRDARQLAAIMDELGGEVNAFTDFDSLCVYGSTPKSQFHELADLLREILLEHQFGESELALEKDIVRQEILEANDSPSDATYQCLNRTLWPNSILRFPVFGTLESVQRISLGDLGVRKNQLLVGRRCVVACCGAVDADAVIRYAESSFGHLPRGEEYRFQAPPRGSGLAYEEHQATQVYVALSQPWISGDSQDVAAGLVLSTILGGGLSSRLFQKLREEAGLAYEVSTNVEMVGSSANLLTSCVVERDNLDEAIRIIEEEIRGAREGNVTEEVERAKKLLRARFELDMDSPVNRLWYALDHLIRARSFQDETHPEAVLAQLQKLSVNDVRRVAKDVLTEKPEVSVFGGDVKGLKPGLSS